MTNSKYRVRDIRPSRSEFVRLRQQVGWGDTDANLAERSLDNSLFHVTAYLDKLLVGMGRVLGNGAMYFYVQDVVVDPDHQGQGIGSLLMTEIEAYLAQNTTKGSTVGLLAAKGKEGFYTVFGYEERASDSLGSGMSKVI